MNSTRAELNESIGSLPVAPLLAVQDLRIWIDVEGGTVKAVDGVNFTLNRGETLAIVGESGSGKTLTARGILRLIEPPVRQVEGRILFRCSHYGRSDDLIDLATLGPHSRKIQAIRGKHIALVFQEPMASFSPVYTIGNQIIEAVRLHEKVSYQAARCRAIELLERVSVSMPRERVNQYPHELSGGLLQRSMIAMALAGCPTLLIADEPTTALDVTTQAQILKLLDDLKRDSDLALLVITHDLGVVAQIADRVLVMHRGKAVEQGTADAIFHNPQHPYTRSLLQGSSQ